MSDPNVNILVPEGFFEEVASMVKTDSPEERTRAAIAVCVRRGIAYPEIVGEVLADLMDGDASS